jgi:hypothetical protein
MEATMNVQDALGIIAARLEATEEMIGALAALATNNTETVHMLYEIHEFAENAEGNFAESLGAENETVRLFAQAVIKAEEAQGRALDLSGMLEESQTIGAANATKEAMTELQSILSAIQ